MGLFSKNARNDIVRIKKQYEWSLLQEVNFDLGTSYPAYSPLMCLFEKWRCFHEENLFAHFPVQKQVKCMIDFNLLTKLEKILTESSVPLSEITDKEIPVSAL